MRGESLRCVVVLPSRTTHEAMRYLSSQHHRCEGDARAASRRIPAGRSDQSADRRALGHDGPCGGRVAVGLRAYLLMAGCVERAGRVCGDGFTLLDHLEGKHRVCNTPLVRYPCTQQYNHYYSLCDASRTTIDGEITLVGAGS